jgi:hypothetical protein
MKRSPTADRVRSVLEKDGKASQVVAGKGFRTIHYVCAACSCEWVDVVPFPESQWMFLRPSSPQ